MSQLEEINVFIRVTEAGSISKAADQLGIAKSAVSRRLADFEKRMGTRLINRTTRKMNLSEAGARCYEQALRVTDVLEELNATVSNEEQELKGTIRLSMPNSFGLNHMSDVIDTFLKQFPAIQLDIDLSDRFVDLVEAGLDMSIRIGDLKDTSHKARKIAPIKLCLVASPAYLEEFGVPETIEDLTQHKLLNYGNLTDSAIIFYDLQGKKHSLHPKGQITVNNGDFLNQLAIKGHGIVLTPTFISWQEIKKGQLKIVLPDYKLSPRFAYALYPNSRFLPKRVRVFIDFMADYFGEAPYWDEIN